MNLLSLTVKDIFITAVQSLSESAITPEIILLNITGEDKPGVTSTLTKILSNYHMNILDIGQAVIHRIVYVITG